MLGVRWTGLALVLVCVLLRAITASDPFPFWSMDPMRFTQPIVGLAPMQSLIVDVLTMLGAGMVLIAEASSLGGGVLLLPTALTILGSVGVALHAFVLRGWDLDTVRIGGTWVGAMFAGLAVLHACRDPRAARLVCSIAIASLVLIAARGLVQVYVEHPATVEQYRRNREEFIASQGWSPDSASVRAYERRLGQPEATSWFGMSNILASFMAAGQTACLGWTVLAARAKKRRELPDGWVALLVIATIVIAGVLYLTRSKGGYAAAGLGIGLLALALLLQRPPLRALLRRPAVGGVLALALVSAALLAVAIRGLIGERIGELSILFRSFYMRGAIAIFLEHPLLGVGPNGFKEAYQLAKPPISPEEVASPHSILFDFAATLGLFGLAWCGAWLWQVFRAGTAYSALASHQDAPAAQAKATELRADAWICFLVPAVTVILGTMAERAALTPDQAILRIVGLLAWTGIAIAAVALMRIAPAWRIGLAAAAIVLAVHAQIEITPIWQGSAGLFMILIAAAAASGSARARSAALARLGGILVLITAAVWAWVGLAPLARWQGSLEAAAARLAPVANITTRLAALQQPTATESIRDIAQDVAALAGTPVPTSQREFELARAKLVSIRVEQAAQILQTAAAVAPTHIPTIEKLTGLYLGIASAQVTLGETGAAPATSAERTAQGLADRLPTASAYSLLASTLTARHELDSNPEHLKAAAEALEKADQGDPYGLPFPVRLVRVYTALGDRPKAAQWAKVALDRDRLQRLDPIRGLSDPERKMIEAALAESKPAP
jgi:tetratricopeptide (TPR) repeat protein